MKLLKATLIGCSFILSGAALAVDLGGFVEISEGHLAKVRSDGSIVEIATTRKAAEEIMNSEERPEAIVKAIQTISSNVPIDSSLLGPKLCQDFQTRQTQYLDISPGLVTLDGYAAIEMMVGPAAPPPEFAFARVKSKLRLYDSSGTMIDKTVSIRRNANTSPSEMPNSPLVVNYAFAHSIATISTTGAASLRWTVKTEFVVDNPNADDMGFDAKDCYETAGLRIISAPINL